MILAGSSLGVPLLQIYKEGRKLASVVSISALAAAIFLIALNTIYVSPATSFGAMLSSDLLGGFFALVTLGVTLVVAVVSGTQIRESENAAVYYALLSFTALGMVLLAYSADLLMLFIAWELMSLPTYVLAGFDKRRAESNEAAVKYGIIGALSSAIILYAISLTYGVTGTTQIIAAVQSLASHSFNPIATMAVLLFVVGFGFKMSIVPFHMWIPDAYEGAPTTVSTLLAAATKKAGFVAAIRVLLAITTLYVVTQNPLFTMANVFAVLALVTMTLGNVAALTQKSITRLLAYSSIAQAGYMLMGFVIFSYSRQTSAFFQEATIGMTGTLFHILNHAVMKGAAFIVAGLLLLKLRRGDLQTFDGLGRRMPLAAFTMAVSLLSLAGVPPLSGFWSKLLLFTSVIDGPFAWLAVAAVLNSAFSLGYYVWIIKRMYIDEPENSERISEPYPFVVVFAVAVGLMIGIGIFPQQVISFASRAAAGLFGITPA